jgi:hypothetical protein
MATHAVRINQQRLLLGFFRVDNRLQMFFAINALQIRVCRQHFGLMLGIQRSKLRKRAKPTPGQILVTHLSIVAALQRPASPFRIQL